MPTRDRAGPNLSFNNSSGIVSFKTEIMHQTRGNLNDESKFLYALLVPGINSPFYAKVFNRT